MPAANPRLPLAAWQPRLDRASEHLAPGAAAGPTLSMTRFGLQVKYLTTNLITSNFILSEL